MANDNTQDFNLDALLDGTLDDLADIPEFRPYPGGAHKVNITIEYKKLGTHPAYLIKMKAIETVELANTEDTPLQAGATAESAFMLDNDLGQGQFKKVLASLAAHFGTATNRETIEAAQGAECLVVTSVRKGKAAAAGEEQKLYTNIVDLSVI